MPIPPVPLGLSYTINSTGQLILKWFPASGAVSYNIWKRYDALSLFVGNYNTAPVTTTTFTDSQYSGIVASYYSVTAVNASGESLPSQTIYVPVLADGLGFPRVDFIPSAFDVFISQKGYSCIWERAISCPCNKAGQTTASAEDLNCPLCRNKHFIWVNPTPASILMTSLSRDSKLTDNGIIMPGHYKVTAQSYVNIGLYDRLTLTQAHAPLTESLEKGASGGTDKVRFPIINVDSDMPIIDIAGNKYYQNIDFSINASGDIVWDGSSNREPSTGQHYGITYNTHWRMLLVENPHDIRSTKVAFGASTPLYVDLAKQSVGQLEWFFYTGAN